MILERKFENELKHIQDELADIQTKLRLDLGKKVTKNVSRIFERQKSDFTKQDSLPTTLNFRAFHSFVALVSSGLKLHLQLNLTKLDSSHRH